MDLSLEVNASIFFCIRSRSAWSPLLDVRVVIEELVF